MECCKWEEAGLLYSARELDDKGSREFEQHCTQCAECRSELDRYEQERARLYTPEILGASPPQRVDAEILRVCSDPRKQARAAFMPSFFRRALAPVLMLVIGFFSAGYIMLNVQSAKFARGAGKAAASVAERNAGQSANTAAVAVADSAHDSLNSSKVNFARTRGSLKGEGVTPVDLKNR